MTSPNPNLPALIAPEYEAENRHRVEAGFWEKVKRFTGRVPFMEEAVASYFAMADPDTPRRAKLLILAALAYFVAPVDAIPDFIAGLGFTDDAAVFWAVWTMVREHVSETHRLKARQALEPPRR